MASCCQDQGSHITATTLVAPYDFPRSPPRDPPKHAHRVCGPCGVRSGALARRLQELLQLLDHWDELCGDVRRRLMSTGDGGVLRCLVDESVMSG